MHWVGVLIMSHIDWSGTECLFALVNTKKNLTEFFKHKPSTTSCKECWMVTESETLYLKTAWALIEKPDDKPVFTQAMSDQGLLPSVGMKCLVLDSIYYNEYHIGVIKFIGDSHIIWTDGEKELSQARHYLSFKPIPTKPDLIDGAAYQFKNMRGVMHSGIYNSDRDIFSVEQGQYFDCAMVSDIKPLTLEGE